MRSEAITSLLRKGGPRPADNVPGPSQPPGGGYGPTRMPPSATAPQTPDQSPDNRGTLQKQQAYEKAMEGLGELAAYLPQAEQISKSLETAWAQSLHTGDAAQPAPSTDPVMTGAGPEGDGHFDQEESPPPQEPTDG